MLEPSIKKISGHQNSVNAVLEVLDIDPAAPVAAFWLELGAERGRRNLAGWAHRSGLDTPRPLDSEFRDLVRDFELMLDEVLERFRDRYVEVFRFPHVPAGPSRQAFVGRDPARLSVRDRPASRRPRLCMPRPGGVREPVTGEFSLAAAGEVLRGQDVHGFCLASTTDRRQVLAGTSNNGYGRSATLTACITSTRSRRCCRAARQTEPSGL